MHAPRVLVVYEASPESWWPWVEALAARLRADGVEARLDRWHRKGRTQAEFLGAELRAADRVLVLCTPELRDAVHLSEASERENASGLALRLMQTAMQEDRARDWVVPALARGSARNATPDLLKGREQRDLRDFATFEAEYLELLRSILGVEPVLPPVGSAVPNPSVVVPLRGAEDDRWARLAPSRRLDWTRYLQGLRRRYLQREKRGIQPARLLPAQVRPLGSAVRADPGRSPLEPLLEAMDRVPRMNLLGEAGAGKTIALWRRVDALLSAWEAGERGDDVPIPVELARVALLAEQTGDGEALEALLLESVADSLDRPREELSWSDLEADLLGGGFALLLDGLNEVPEGRRAGIIAAIYARADRWDRNHYVVCTRADSGQVRSFGAVELCPLAWEQVASEVRATWPERAEALIELQRRIPLEQLRNPLFLSMVLRAFKPDDLAGERLGPAAVLARYVDHLVAREQEHRQAAGRPEIDEDLLLSRLGRLALHMHRHGQRINLDALPADLGAGGQQRVEDTLADATACGLVRALDGKNLRFWHQTLLTWFAGRELARQWEASPAAVSRLSRDRSWWEPLAVAAGLLEGPQQTRFLDAAERRGPLLAAMALAQAGQARGPRGDRLLARVQRSLRWLAAMGWALSPVGIAVVALGVPLVDGVFLTIVGARPDHRGELFHAIHSRIPVYGLPLERGSLLVNLGVMLLLLLIVQAVVGWYGTHRFSDLLWTLERAGTDGARAQLAALQQKLRRTYALFAARSYPALHLASSVPGSTSTLAIRREAELLTFLDELGDVSTEEAAQVLRALSTDERQRTWLREGLGCLAVDGGSLGPAARRGLDRLVGADQSTAGIAAALSGDASAGVATSSSKALVATALRSLPALLLLCAVTLIVGTALGFGPADYSDDKRELLSFPLQAALMLTLINFFVLVPVLFHLFRTRELRRSLHRWEREDLVTRSELIRHLPGTSETSPGLRWAFRPLVLLASSLALGGLVALDLWGRQHLAALEGLGPKHTHAALAAGYECLVVLGQALVLSSLGLALWRGCVPVPGRLSTMADRLAPTTRGLVLGFLFWSALALSTMCGCLVGVYFALPFMLSPLLAANGMPMGQAVRVSAVLWAPLRGRLLLLWLLSNLTGAVASLFLASMPSSDVILLIICIYNLIFLFFPVVTVEIARRELRRLARPAGASPPPELGAPAGA